VNGGGQVFTFVCVSVCLSMHIIVTHSAAALAWRHDINDVIILSPANCDVTNSNACCESATFTASSIRKGRIMVNYR